MELNDLIIELRGLSEGIAQIPNLTSYEVVNPLITTYNKLLVGFTGLIDYVQNDDFNANSFKRKAKSLINYPGKLWTNKGDYEVLINNKKLYSIADSIISGVSSINNVNELINEFNGLNYFMDYETRAYELRLALSDELSMINPYFLSETVLGFKSIGNFGCALKESLSNHGSKRFEVFSELRTIWDKLSNSLSNTRKMIFFDLANVLA